MRILVTGGCGFVGASLIGRLAARGGYAVRVLDNESVGRRSALAGLGVDFVHGDVRDAETVHHAMEGVEAVVHLAADTRVMDSIADPAFNFRVNALGGLNVLEAMRAHGVRRLVNASTGGAILGEAPAPVHEEMVAKPMAPYGAAKLCMEGYCSAYGASYGLQPLSLRFSNVYGPGSYRKGSVIAAFFKRLIAGQHLTVYGDGEQTRDFVFIDDLCEGILAALESDASGVVQLGSGRPTTINALLSTLVEAVRPLSPLVVYEPARAGEIQSTWCDISKARRLLGFAPQTPLFEGLSRTWRWFQAENDLAA